MTRSEIGSIRPAEAAARLRQVEAVRHRVRQATAISPVVLLVLGGALVARGALAHYWPHLALGWLVVLVAIRLIGPHMARRPRSGGGIVRAWRVRAALILAGAAGLAIAWTLGLNPLITTVTVAVALSAHFAGRRVLVFPTVAAGLLCDELRVNGAARSETLILFGAALVVLGLANRSRAPGQS